MKLLGSLGIDWHLFLIQCLNFIILFLILKWAFYKPIINILRKEKEELEKARREKEEIEKEKRRFLKEREEILRSAREKARKLIEQSEKMTLEFRKEMRREKEEEEKKLKEKLKEEKDLLREALLERWRENFLKEKEKELISLMRREFSPDFLKESQEYFFEKLLENIRGANIDFSFKIEEVIRKLDEMIKKAPLGEEERGDLEKAFRSIKEGENVGFYFKKFEEVLRSLKNNYLYKKFRKVWEELRIEVKLDCAFPLREKERSLLENIIKEKLKDLEFSLKEKIDKNLLSGFRLEIEGFLIEANLASEIHQIIHGKL